MRKIICSLQQGTIARDRIAALEASLRGSYQQVEAGSRPFVIWAEIPRGQAWTEGRPSDVSYLMVEVPDGMNQAAREQAMLALAAAFASTAGVAVEKLMVTLCDSSLFGQYLKANSARMRLLPRIGFLLRTLIGLWSSRRRDGHASIAVNF